MTNDKNRICNILKYQVAINLVGAICLTKPVQLSTEARAKVEIYAKDNELSLQEAASTIILQNADLLAANTIRENSNCMFDLFKWDISTGEKDFTCPIKRQRPDLRHPDKMPILAAEYCGKCPMLKTARDMFKFEMRLRDKQDRPQPRAPQVLAIQKELERDTATVHEPSHVFELPPGLARVGCDSCHDVFNFDNIDKGLDDFTQHLKEEHGDRSISHNEANQFRDARTRLERGQAA